MYVFSNFLTSFNVQSPYLFLNTLVIANLDGNLRLARKVNIATYIITKVIVLLPWNRLTALSNKPKPYRLLTNLIYNIDKFMRRYKEFQICRISGVSLLYPFSGISYITGKRVERKPSAVSDHLLLRNHDNDFNDFTILYRDNNGFKLLLKESLP